jgi:hypothetical protein
MISKKQMDVAQERYDAMIPEFDDSEDDETEAEAMSKICSLCGKKLLANGKCKFDNEEIDE